MEVEPAAHLPLDFSVTMVNIKFNSANLNNNNNINSNNLNEPLSPIMPPQNGNSLASAFKVVTPRGKADGKIFFMNFL